MTTMVIVLGVVIMVLLYVIWNLLQKLEAYEAMIEQFYSAISVTLTTMRMIDQKQMFETDDEVGTVFQQLVDVLANLRHILYGIEEDENKKN